ncbi:MAG: twin-arginine translocase subunit TatC, partial [Planctomycetota bacterium]
MSLGDHLEELRGRLLLAIFGLAIGAVVSLVFGTRIIRFIERPYFQVMGARAAKAAKETAKATEPNEATFGGLLLTNMLARLESDPNAPHVDPNLVSFLGRVHADTVKQWREGAASRASEGRRLPGLGNSLVTLGPAEAFVSYMKISLISGLILTCPWVFYQIWMFVAAGLYPRERHYVRSAVPFSAGLFICGALFFLFVVARISLGFFLYFGDLLGVASNWTLQKYVSFVTLLMLAFGIAFQTPIAIFILNRTGLVALVALRSVRPYVFLSCFILSAIATPPDPLSQISLALPLYGLYELGIVLAHLAGNKEAQERTKKALRLFAILLVIALVGGVLSAAVYQYGHVIGAKLVGATVTDVQPFVFLGRPTCSYEGDLTSAREAVITIAGLLTCFAAGLLALLLVPFKKFSSRTGLFVAAFVAPLPGQSLLWLVVPTFHLLGRQWQHSAIDFARQSGFHPVLVALIGLALTVLGLK